MALLLVCSVSSYGKSPLRFGIKAGTDISRLAIANNNAMFNNESTSFGFGFYGGGLLEISGPAGSKFKGQVEALFAQRNFKNSYTTMADFITIDEKTSLSQISVPVSVKYFIIPSLSVNVGASVNFNLASKTKADASAFNAGGSTEIDNKEQDYLQTLQVGALGGITYYIYKGFFVDARYNYYFGKTLDLKNDRSRPGFNNMSSIQIGIGYKF